MGWIIPAAGLLGSVLGGIGAHKAAKAQQKSAKDEAAKKYAAGAKQHANREATRIALLKTLLGNAAGRTGERDLTVDPSMLEAQPYSGMEPVENPTGYSGGASLLSGLGGLISSGAATAQAGKDADARKAELDRIQCLLVPQMCAGGVPGAGSTGSPYDPGAGL